MSNVWFNNTNCSVLKINRLQSISERKIIQTITIDDPDAINHFINRISRIPANGDMMKSFGPNAEEIDLIFHCGNEKQVISIFEHQFQTPSTGFNAEKNTVEEDLYRDIDALLFPEFNKRIPKIKNLPLSFNGFTVVYKGYTFEDFHPETIQIHTQKFTIKDQKQLHNIEIRSGQIAPQPKSIKLQINKMLPFTSKILLNTYRSSPYRSTQSEDLYPDYFQIVK